LAARLPYLAVALARRPVLVLAARVAAARAVNPAAGRALAQEVVAVSVVAVAVATLAAGRGAFRSAAVVADRAVA
jgi:hypothetical protein